MDQTGGRFVQKGKKMGVLGRISELVCLHGMKVGISQLSGNLQVLQWTDISPVGRGECFTFNRHVSQVFER